MTVLLLASLPLPLSVNQLYREDWIKRRRVLTKEGIAYKKRIAQALAKGQLELPYHIYYRDSARVEEYRDFMPARSKKVQPITFRMEYSFVYGDERRDIDGGIKCIQDCIADWLGVNDRRVACMHVNRIVSKTCDPHMEIVVREYTQFVRTDDLIASTLAELHTDSYYTLLGEYYTPLATTAKEKCP